MQKLPDMVDLSIDQKGEEMPEATNLSIPQQYPYGLSICLDDSTLKRLDMDEDCAVGDHFAFHALAKVCSSSDREGQGKRIELQIIAMSPLDADEDEEEEQPAHKIRNPYDR